MHFLLQLDTSEVDDKELLDLKYILRKFYPNYDMDELATDDFKIATFGKTGYIPVGDLGFVKAFLEIVKGSSYMKPLEIPKFLRKKEYLHRKYEICSFRDLPKTGIYFIKDASLLKAWQPKVINFALLSEMIPKVFEDWKEHMYVYSSVLDIIYSEYRVLVCRDKVVGVQYYGGEKILDYESLNYYSDGFNKNGVLTFPDSSTIKSILTDIKLYRESGGTFPLSYTLDVAVTDRGTCLLEVHNFVSCGTYGFSGKELITMYADGIEYELNN